jgi:pyruvate dehydrogenase phosphatase
MLPVPSGWWSFLSVLDGHGGIDTARWLRDNLVVAVSGALADTYQSVKAKDESDADPRPSAAVIEKTLKETFFRLDEDIVDAAIDLALVKKDFSKSIRLLGPSYAGPSAAFAFYDSHTCMLHAAVAGDSQITLGRRIITDDGSVSHEAITLSGKQAVSSAAGSLHLRNLSISATEHSQTSSRTFSSGRFEADTATQDELIRQWADRFPANKVTTASIKIRPGDFLFIGSSGFRRACGKYDSVGFVSRWLGSASRARSITRSQSSLRQDELTQRSNVASDLIRDAMNDQASAVNERYARPSLWALCSSLHRYSDDITVAVAFFDT